MNVSPEEFRRRFEQLSDDALLDINPEDLTEVARELYDAEIERRGLDLQEEEEPETSEPADAEQPPENMELAAEFGSAQEATFARSLLKSAGIPYYTKTDFSGILGATEEELQVFVPAAYLQQAQELLSTPLSDEELAAQAEAAGPEEAAEESEAGEAPDPGKDIQL